MVQVYRKTHSYPDPPPTPLLAFFLRYPNPFARHVLSVDVLSRDVDPSTGQVHTTRLILKRGILPKWATKWLPAAATSGGRGLDAWILEHSVVDPPGWGLNSDDGLGTNNGESSTSSSSSRQSGTASSSSSIARMSRTNGLTQHNKRSSGEANSDTNSDSVAELDYEYRRQPRLRVQQGNLNHKKLMHVIEGGEIRAGPDGTTLHHTTAEVRSSFGGAWSNMIRNRIESYGVGKFETNSETSRKGMSLILTLLRTRHPLPETAEFEFYPPPPPGFNDSWSDIPEAISRASVSPKSKEGSPKSFFLSPSSIGAWVRARREGGNGSPESDEPINPP
ncbi:uncharacterized protein I303_100600 [Kwoniella dejecticola CBS 10117]|uniref:PRELI/MSF1 domain-containing protein n=1 Tax=Kwoniella dejecticola CBS 10117 TaxID=1296121 RepID=A0A1A6AFF2_9TREE|nr:uncharacterized protein I303_00603 [Kwoniella dejecticola CBS 10117]OBR88786.1 hypothetical protein I303_00603 [Kwoniella dejecticola CBS 10117]